MIIRILGEGQFELDDMFVQSLNVLDDALQACLEGDREDEFASFLADMLLLVRLEGQPVPADSMEPSQAILPPQGASLNEVRRMIGEKGFIPG